MDIKGTAELGVAPARNERRDLARDLPHEREASPGVLVEIGRPPELAGTYNARGVREGSPVAAKPLPVASPLAGAPPVEHLPLEVPAPTTFGAPETLRMPGNAQVQTLASASPHVAASLRPTLPMEAPHLHPPLALTAGIQTLASNALKQAEKGNATAEHDEEADPLRKEKEPNPRERGRSRQR